MPRRERFDWEAFLIGAACGFVLGVAFLAAIGYIAVELLA